MPNHPFNQTVHDTVDPICRQVVIEYFKQKEFDFHSNPDIYGVDLLSDGAQIGLELEHRDIWCGDTYKYQTYHFLQRKEHFFKESKTFKPYFIVINSDYTHGMMINKERILPHLREDNLKQIQCWDYNRGGYYKDLVFDVPISEFIPLHLNN